MSNVVDSEFVELDEHEAGFPGVLAKAKPVAQQPAKSASAPSKLGSLAAAAAAAKAKSAAQPQSKPAPAPAPAKGGFLGKLVAAAKGKSAAQQSKPAPAPAPSKGGLLGKAAALLKGKAAAQQKSPAAKPTKASLFGGLVNKLKQKAATAVKKGVTEAKKKIKQGVKDLKQVAKEKLKEGVSTLKKAAVNKLNDLKGQAIAGAKGLLQNLKDKIGFTGASNDAQPEETPADVQQPTEGQAVDASQAQTGGQGVAVASAGRVVRGRAAPRVLGGVSGGAVAGAVGGESFQGVNGQSAAPGFSHGGATNGRAFGGRGGQGVRYASAGGRAFEEPHAHAQRLARLITYLKQVLQSIDNGKVRAGSVCGLCRVCAISRLVSHSTNACTPVAFAFSFQMHPIPVGMSHAQHNKIVHMAHALGAQGGVGALSNLASLLGLGRGNTNIQIDQLSIIGNANQVRARVPLILVSCVRFSSHASCFAWYSLPCNFILLFPGDGRHASGAEPVPTDARRRVGAERYARIRRPPPGRVVRALSLFVFAFFGVSHLSFRILTCTFCSTRSFAAARSSRG